MASAQRLQFWETLMREQGASLVMTSSQQDEREPQMWHRRNGYKEAGILHLSKIQDAAEVFLQKLSVKSAGSSPAE